MIKNWIKKFNEKLHKANEDDRGSAFVMVIIGVMATAIIGATLLSLSTNYFVSVVVDQQGTDNFYETEAIIAEIRSGIEEIAGVSNEVAYMKTLDEYDASSGSLQDVYSKLFLSGVIYGIKNQNGFTKDTYADHVQTNYMDGDTKIDSTKFEQGYRSDELDKTGDPYVSKGDDNYFSSSLLQSMITRQNTIVQNDIINYYFYQDKSSGRRWLTLNNICILYKDDQGYQTEIKTDMVINVPDYQFEGEDTFDQLKNYISISDERLEVEGQTGVSFNGNVYAGGDHTSSYEYSDGIVTNAESQVSFDSDKIITRGALKLLTGSSITVNAADFWTKNILLDPFGSPATANGSTLNLNCNSYVLDDLSVNDNNANVILGGTYYGYSYNIDNVDDSSRKQLADYSSAILVNGKNTLLDAASNLSKLVLAGRAFVQRNESDGVKSASDVEDITMGESAAVKSNQVAYMLPEEYIVKGHNPLLTATEFDSANLDANYDKYRLLNDLGTYLNKTKPITLNYNNAGGYVYLYLNFKDDKSANEYFSQFYSNRNPDNVDMINERAQTYITSDLAATPQEGILISPTLYLLAGNVITNYWNGTADGTSNKMEANYFASSDVSASLLDDGRKKMKQYMSLQLSLVGGKYTTPSSVAPRMETYYDEATSEEKDQIDLVKDRVVDFSSVPATGQKVSFKDGSAYITKNGISKLSELGISKGLVISGDDINVDCKFEGLIISGGKITVKQGGSYLKSNASILVEILDWIKQDETWKEFFYATKEKDKPKKTIAECISYENWTKN